MEDRVKITKWEYDRLRDAQRLIDEKESTLVYYTENGGYYPQQYTKIITDSKLVKDYAEKINSYRKRLDTANHKLMELQDELRHERVHYRRYIIISIFIYAAWAAALLMVINL